MVLTLVTVMLLVSIRHLASFVSATVDTRRMNPIHASTSMNVTKHHVAFMKIALTPMAVTNALVPLVTAKKIMTASMSTNAMTECGHLINYSVIIFWRCGLK